MDFILHVSEFSKSDSFSAGDDVINTNDYVSVWFSLLNFKIFHHHILSSFLPCLYGFDGFNRWQFLQISVLYIMSKYENKNGKFVR